MKNNILYHAIAVEGTARALVAALVSSGLKISAPAISEWKKRGLPLTWKEILTTRYTYRKAIVKTPRRRSKKS